MAVNHETSTYKNSDYAKFAKLSWKFWCKKNNIDFIVIDKHDRYKFPVWNKDTIFDIVGDTYDKIGYVDSDSMIHWDAPNPFDLYTDEWCWSKDYSNLRWTYNSSNYYQKFYPDIKLDLYNYYSSAIKFFFTKEHKPIFDGLIKLYEDNAENLTKQQQWVVVKFKRFVIMKFKKQGIKTKELDIRWNMFPNAQKRNVWIQLGKTEMIKQHHFLSNIVISGITQVLVLKTELK